MYKRHSQRYASSRLDSCTPSEDDHSLEAHKDLKEVEVYEKSMLGEKSDVYDVIPETVEEGHTTTFRSFLVGVIASVVAGAISQFFMFKPTHVRVDILFVQVVCFLLGRAFAYIPGPLWWNPGEFSVKEVVFSTIMAASAAGGAMGVETLAAQDLYFNRKVGHVLSLMTLVSSQLIGYGFAGILRPFLVSNPNIPFPSVLPNVTLFHSMSGKTDSTRNQISFFKKAMILTALYEVLPTYLMPALQAISPWCLVLPQVPAITNLFGGSLPGEGMGLFAFSADWTLVGSYSPLYVPLVAQLNEVLAFFASVFLFMAAYRYNFFGAGSLPFLSFHVFDNQDRPYDLKSAIFTNGTANAKVIKELGIPRYPAAFVLCKSMICMATSASITCAVFAAWSNYKRKRNLETNSVPTKSFSQSELPKKKFSMDLLEFGYIALFFFSAGLAFATTQLAETGLSVLGLTAALALSFVLSLTAGYFFGTVGIPLFVTPAVQMIGGFLFPGNAIGNMWFSTYGSTSVMQSVLMLKDLKLGQYMQLTPVSVVIAQLAGTLVGVVVHYGVMILIVGSQREVLLLPNGNGIFTGTLISLLAAEATSWGIFARDMYSPGKIYFILPVFLLLGFFVPIPFLIFSKYRPQSILSRFNPSLFCASMAQGILSATSGRSMAFVVGIVSQFAIRKYHFGWYKKYNYILCAALDGGTQISVLLLGFILQGGAGFKVTFPIYALNPQGPKDYCMMPHPACVPPGGH